MDEILVKDLNDIISKCEEHPNSSLQVELMNYILAREDKIRKCDFCGSHDDELKGWQKDFINEFRKHYQGILSEEIIKISIAWHLNFMGKYIPSPGLVALDEDILGLFIYRAYDWQFGNGTESYSGLGEYTLEENWTAKHIQTVAKTFSIKLATFICSKFGVPVSGRDGEIKS